MDHDASFGRWLQQRRKALDLTQEELGRQVGCSGATIRKIEADERRPSKEIAERLAACLQITEAERPAFLRFARGESSTTLPRQPARNLVPVPEHQSQSQQVRTNLPSLPTGALEHKEAAPAWVRTTPVREPDTAELVPERRETLPADRNRSRMLKKVRDFWITGVLEHSLHGAALIELGLETQPQAVVHPWAMMVQQPDQAQRSLPANTRIIEVFDALNGEMLILGAPGAGKTTLLLELTRDLLDGAEQDAIQPMPVVFNLSSWATRRRPLSEWLVDELNERYDVPRRIGEAWVEADQILPLLDGLDEVKSEHRAACVGAINAFRREHGLVGLVVCSRSEDYAVLSTKLKLQGAVLIQPLTMPQICSYLSRAGDQLDGLRVALEDDPVLQELAQTPLLLNIMMLAYRGMPVEALMDRGTLEERRQHLFAAYVERMLQRRGIDPRYSREQTIHWLSWLARGMVQQAQSVFLIEGLQPNWLADRVQRRLYAVAEGMIVGLLFGFVLALTLAMFGLREIGLVGGLYCFLLGLLGGLLTAVFAAVTNSEESRQMKPGQERWQYVHHALRWGGAVGLGYAVSTGLFMWADAGLVIGLGAGLANGLTLGIITGLGFGLLTKPGKVNIVETFDWSWSKAKPAAAIGLVVGLGFGLWLWLGIGISGGPLVGLLLGLIAGLSFGITGSEIEIKTVPNQGVRRSAHNALRIGLLGTLVVGLSFRLAIGPLWGFGGALLGGLFSALWFGGLAYIQHHLLRFMLYRDGRMPWNIARFLDYCTERIFLRKVGGGYIFVHRLLLEYFATLDTKYK